MTSSRIYTPQPPPVVGADALATALAGLDPEQIKTLLSSHLARAQHPGMPVGRDWEGGMLELRPADSSLQSKLIPIDQFLHKLVMIRDNLRVLEQKVNSNKVLHDGEKVDLQRMLGQAKTAVTRFASEWQGAESPDDDSAAADKLLKRLGREVGRALLAGSPPVIAERWGGGMAVFVTEDASIEEPLEIFFERLVRVRDRLRALESSLGNHSRVGADDTSGMVTYLRRCHGSLTTFNVLLRDRAHYFSSSR